MISNFLRLFRCFSLVSISLFLGLAIGSSNLSVCSASTAWFQTNETATKKDEEGRKNPNRGEELSFRIFPKKNVRFWFAVRPGLLKKSSLVKRVAKVNPKLERFLGDEGFFVKQTGLPFSQFSQYTSLVWQTLKQSGLDPKNWQSWRYHSATILQTNSDCQKNLRKHAKAIVKIDDFEILTMVEEHKKTASDGLYPTAVIIDPTTILLLRFQFLPQHKKRVIDQIKTIRDLAARENSRDKDLTPFKKCAIFEFQEADSSVSFPMNLYFPFVRDELATALKEELQSVGTSYTGLKIGENLYVHCRLVHRKISLARTTNEKLNQLKGSYHKIAKFFSKAESRNIKTLAKTAVASIETIEIKRSGTDVNIRGDLKLSERGLNSIIDKYSEQVLEETTHDRMATIGRSFFLFENDFGKFPSAVYKHKSGNRHSWRIMILPYIGHQDLFDKYRLDQPWDSPHNQKMTAKMPDVFRHPMAKDQNSNSAGFTLVTGEGFAFADPEKSDRNYGVGIRDFTDGTSNTIVGVETSVKTHWADPTSLTFQDVIEKGAAGGYGEEKFRVIMGDGSTQEFRTDVPEETLRNLFTIGGGDMFKFNDVRSKRPTILSLEVDQELERK